MKLGPNVIIGNGVKIGKGVRILNSIILDGSEIKVNFLSFFRIKALYKILFYAGIHKLDTGVELKENVKIYFIISENKTCLLGVGA